LYWIFGKNNPFQSFSEINFIDAFILLLIYQNNFQITPVAWKINEKWVCASPQFSYCPVDPKTLTPLQHQFNVMMEYKSLGDGLYSTSQMIAFRNFMASGGNVRQITHEMGDAVLEGSKPKFNIFSLLNNLAVGDLKSSISGHIFGIFSGLDTYIYPALTIYGLWSVFLFIVRAVMALKRVYATDGISPRKMISVLLDPIIYLLWLPLNMGARAEQEEHQFDAEHPVPNAPLQHQMNIYPNPIV
jgi:hypothetical protein